jgi:hypothetical protein
VARDYYGIMGTLDPWPSLRTSRLGIDPAAAVERLEVWVSALSDDQCAVLQHAYDIAAFKRSKTETGQLKLREVARRSISRKHGIAVWEKTDGRCFYCGAQASTADHVVPRALGGANTVANKVPACWDCNSGKGVQPVEEFRARQGHAEFWAERELGASL